MLQNDRVNFMKRIFSLSLVLLFLAFSIGTTWATIGVGVGTGKIQLDEKLKPGTLYELPSITVINTGDEAGDYLLDITFHQDQPELRPDPSWFTYKPNTFNLEPGEAQEVQVMLTLPVKTVPGDYFAYLEARPKATADQGGGAAIGVAAASKLYFSVAPANLLLGIYYRTISLWKKFTPYPQIAIGALTAWGLIRLAGNYISLDVNLKKAQKKESPEKDTTDEK